MSQVIIYTTQTCPFCKMAKNFLSGHNIKFSEKDVTHSAELQQEMINKSGQMAVPVIDIDGQIVVGFDKQKISEILNLKTQPNSTTWTSL